MRRALIFLPIFLGSFALGAEKTESPPPKPRRFWVDVGAGMPQLASLEASYRLFPRWQIGASYGLIPGTTGGLSPSFSIPSQNVTLANNQFVTFESPTIKSNLSSLCPFFRFFPNDSNFYIQMTIAMLQVKNDFSSTILDVHGNQILDASYKGTITVTQFLPTLSIGRAFASELFFFNVNMGVTIVATTQVTTATETLLPDSLGGNEANQSQIDNLNQQASNAINSGMDVVRDQIRFLPSIHLTWGFMF